MFMGGAILEISLRQGAIEITNALYFLTFKYFILF